jgi:hypothetical protein
MSILLALGLLAAFPGQQDAPPVAADAAAVRGVVIDTKNGEVAFGATVQHPTGKPCIDAWGRRPQAFVGTATAGGKPSEFADHFVFLADADVEDVYRGLAEVGLQIDKHLSREEGKKVAGRAFLKGDPVSIVVTWKEGDKWVEKPYESFVKEKTIVDGKEVVGPWKPKWAFHGSGVIHKEATGSIACPGDCPCGLIADVRNPILDPMPTVFFDLKAAPPKGTRVIVKIRPAYESKKP